MVKKINSRNAEFQKFQVLKTSRNKRHKYGEFFVEGVRKYQRRGGGRLEITSFLYTRGSPSPAGRRTCCKRCPPR